jgi:dihydrofolate synthase/folylpolyglutamate synthase
VIAAATALGLSAGAARDAASALETVSATAGAAPLVLIGGSLYLAGTVLAANGTPPT